MRSTASTGVEFTTKVSRTVGAVSTLSIARSLFHNQELSSGWIVGTLALRDRFGEVVEVLTIRKIDVCYVQEVKWRGTPARLVTGKVTEYKFFWSGSSNGVSSVGILVRNEWVDKIVEVNMVNDRLMFLKLLIGSML